MKNIMKYFFMTLIIVQGLFIFFWYVNFNFMGLLSWMGRGDSVNVIKLFIPLIIYGCIKVGYWIADPLSKIYTVILRWTVIFGIIYLFYLLFVK
jgi:hypothetical protein